MAKRLARQRGLALIIVLTVLLALVIIATPFVLSMVLQEKTATTEKQQRQADYGADGVKNYAAWRMMRGHDYVERDFSGSPDAYLSDPHTEFQALIPSSMSAGMKGSIWGVTIQDEQGKINVQTAPDALLARFRGTQLVDSRIVDLKNFLTLYSVREARWVYPQRVRGVGNFQVNSTTTVHGLRVDSGAHYGPRARLRVVKPGLRALEVVVARNWGNIVETTPDVGAPYDGGIVELELRHPVNLNTASREVLTALFEGLRLVGTNTTPITHDQAMKVADRFYRKGLVRLEDFAASLVAVRELSDDQKVAAALNAVNPVHAALGGTGTMPLTFKSFDVLTFEAFSSVNAPVGIETAGRGFREVMSLAPPILLQHVLESQYDFDAYYQFASAINAVGAGSVQGFPFGGKITTFPNLGLPSDITLKPQPANQEAFFEITPARDNRGTASIFATREHFDNTHEGQELRGSTIRYPWSQVFAQYPRSAVGTPNQMPDVAAGGTEFWIRFDQPSSSIRFFDVRQGDAQNRVSLEYDVSTGIPELVFTLADGTLGIQGSMIDNGTAQIRTPFVPTADKTWYHVGSYWKGTRYAHAALLIDGYADPTAKFMHYSPEGDRLLTSLRADLNQTATNWTLSDTAMVPQNEPSVWMVGSEVILYDPTSSTLVRGVRGTSAQDHPANAVVQIFGYSSKLRSVDVTADFSQLGKPAAGTVRMNFDRVKTGGGRLLYAIGVSPTATVLGDKQDQNNPNQTIIDESQTDIPVVSPDITQYPDQGHIMIEDEVIYYTGRSGNKFTGCQRGQHGTTAVQHNTGQQIYLWGLAASDYTNYLDPTLLQIDGEWFGPAVKDTVHANHWIGYVNGAIPAPFLRGGQVMGSIQSSHAANADIIPIWAARESDPSVARRNLGTGDRVTITDDRNQSEMRRILWVGEQGNGWQFSVQDAQLAGFRDNVTREFVVDNLHVRVLKFPSGELLGLNYLQTDNPQFTMGPMDATVDELKFFASDKGNFTTAGTVNESASRVPMNSAGALSPTGGAVKIGDEIVGYAQVNGTVLAPTVRGFLNTQPQVHDQGDLAFNMSFLPIATLLDPVPSASTDIRVSQGSTQNAIDMPEGYAAIRTGSAQEVVMYTEVIQNEDRSLTLRMPSKIEAAGVGLFRGRFGTPAMDHSPDALVYFLPYRWWDTYEPQQWDNRMAYYQAVTNMESARWRKATWTEEKPANDPNLRTHLLVRIDGKSEWFTPPGGDLFDFTNPSGKNAINRIGFENEAGQLELRFYFEYVAGFWPQHSWKRATRIKEVRVEYDRPTRTLYHEDR